MALELASFKCVGGEVVVKAVGDGLLCEVERILGWSGEEEVRVGIVAVGRIKSYAIDVKSFKAVLEGGLIFEAGCKKY